MWLLHTPTKSRQPLPPDIAVLSKNTINEGVTQLPYLKGLLLAYPVTADENFRISLLIGVDHHWDIVENDIIRGDGPTAVGSKFGYFLSGPLPLAPSFNGTSLKLKSTQIHV